MREKTHKGLKVSESDSHSGRAHREVPSADDFSAALIAFQGFMVQHFLCMDCSV